jgi:hypothetical protein
MEAVKSELKTALTTRDGKAASRFHSTSHINSGLGVGGRWCGAAAPVGISPGAKKLILRIKICDFQRSINVKLSVQMKENSIEYCDFFSIHNLSWGEAVVITRSGVQKPDLHHCTHVPILAALSQNNCGKLFLHIIPFNNKTTHILDTMTTVILI